MPHYRLRLFARDKRNCRSVELDFPCDEAAVGAIESHVRGPAMELWQGERLVANFESAHRALEAP